MSRSALVIVVDRLGAGFLGPYGNTWLETPSLNRLATRSLLVEHFVADSPHLEGFYNACWEGRHALCPGPAEPARTDANLLTLLAAEGVATTLLTDAEPIVECPLGESFGERLHETCGSARSAETLADTQFARIFASAIDWLARRRGPFLGWLHLAGMEGPWDAPWTLREHFADEDDPTPPTGVTPPNRYERGLDPDVALGWSQAYAAQVAALDACLGVFLDAVDQQIWSGDCLLLFCSPRGYPLGEHDRIGPCDHALFGELLQTPCLLHRPDSPANGQRSQAISQPADLYATLAEWFQLEVPRHPFYRRSLLELNAASQPLHAVATAREGSQRAIRTPAWFLRTVPDEPHSLFAKPDDRWEQNPVAQRCPEIVADLAAVFEAYVAATALPPETPPPDLPDQLSQPHR